MDNVNLLPYFPESQKVRLWRGGNNMACTNVRRVYVLHSPSGFEWGYSGSGPADLALNILLAVMPQNKIKAEHLHQKFKEDFIAKIPKQGGEISIEAIRRWVKEQKYP